MTEMRPRRGHSSGRRAPITPTGSFIASGGVGEEASDAGVDFLLAGFAGEVLQSLGELGGPGGEVFGDEIEDLGAVVGGGFGPGFGGVCSLHRVADVLAVADAGVAEEFSLRRVDGLGVAAVRAGLFAADVHLGGAVERVDHGV
jgi:hypothetical protein